MAASAFETHKKSTHEFIMNVVRQTGSHAELMVVIETAILTTMLVSQRLYAIAPETSVEMIESAIVRATERFAEQQNGTRYG